MPQLDALRAFAVFFIMMAHYIPEDNFLYRIFPWGGMGVRLFFVLSGFLVTIGLLVYKNQIDLENKNTWSLIRKFYLRRVLRILPIYYITILIVSIFNIGNIRQHLFWHISYLSNIYISFNGWIGYASHFWTLAVEIQFYLIWPFIIIFADRKHLKPIILLTIAIAPISRILFLLIGADTAAIAFTTSNFDALGFGALIAYYNWESSFSKISLNKVGNYGLIIGLFILITAYVLRASSPDIGKFNREYYLIILDLNAYTLISTWLIINASNGFKGVIGKILTAKFIIYLGKISYGIYLFHNFINVIIFYPKLFKILHLPYPSSIEMQIIYKILATVLISALSWQIIENPINSLKSRFK
ncbi:acyltransferase family protein [Anabaena subtropica]|nr:acyltransferase [Anabaena subtropica]